LTGVFTKDLRKQYVFASGLWTFGLYDLLEPFGVGQLHATVVHQHISCLVVVAGHPPPKIGTVEIRDLQDATGGTSARTIDCDIPIGSQYDMSFGHERIGPDHVTDRIVRKSAALKASGLRTPVMSAPLGDNYLGRIH